MMFKKFLFFSIILLLGILLFHATYATDVVMNLETTENGNQLSENTASLNATQNTLTNDVASHDNLPFSTTTDYEDSADLSVSNMINIILIVVGVVLVLLGIAIIIRLK